MGETNLKVISISGCRGFIGTHLANTLVAKGFKVIGIDNMSHPSYLPLDERVDFRWGDVRNLSDCRWLVENSDVVIHLAAEISVDKSIEDPYRVWDINTTGTLNVLECARLFGTAVILASSSEVYGSAQTKLQNESHPLCGQSPYAVSKIAADRLAYAYHHTYGLDVKIVRSFNVCGEGQGFDSYGAVIAIFNSLIKKNKDIKIFGDGKQTRDYVYVKDLIDAYILIMTKGKSGEVYNVATSQDHSINEIAEKLKQLIGNNVNSIYTKPRPGEVRHLRGDARKLRKLGWKPSITFNQALTRIYKLS